MSVDKAERKAERGLVVPEHGRGKIWQGTPANVVPGPGRPPSKVKAALRQDFDDRRVLLNQIADGDVPAKVSDRIRALEVMAKFSDLEGEKIDKGLIEELGAAVMAEVADHDTVRRIRDRWVDIVARRIAGE